MPTVPAGVFEAFASRADIADLALLIWALTMTAAFVAALREAAAANRRFDDFFEAFLAEFARFNARFAPRDEETDR